MVSGFPHVVLLTACLLTGCGGSKVIEENDSFNVTEPIAQSSDQSLLVALDWIIVRDGPGAWATNVDWDEYLFRFANLSDIPIRVLSVAIVDSMGERIDLGGNRRQLIEQTKAVSRRYEQQEIEVKAGMGGAAIAGMGVLVYGTAAIAVGATLAAGSATGLAAAGIAAGAAIVIAPVLIVGGIMRGINEHEVSERIESRLTQLPVVLPPFHSQHVTLFYPIAPSPLEIEILYSKDLTEYRLSVDTHVVLDGLHLAPVAD